jgi:hypothetical protein
MIPTRASLLPQSMVQVVDFSNKQAIFLRTETPRGRVVRSANELAGLFLTFAMQILGSVRRLPNLVTFSRLNGTVRIADGLTRRN